MKSIYIKRTASVILSFILLLSAVGCSDGGVFTPVQAKDLMAEITRSDDITKKEITDTSAFSSFSAKLFSSCYSDGENTLISPLSVISALAMTSNGAVGDTLLQMQNVLGMTKEELNEFMYSYMSSLSEGEKYKLSLANSIWFTDDDSFTVNPDFLTSNANYYGADIYKTRFDTDACKEINAWVKNKTDGMIESILDEISPSAVMYLINALSFDAEWEEIYFENQVRSGVFKTVGGEEKETDFMHCIVSDFLSDDDSTGFIKYYSGRKYAFAALLPNEGTSLSDYVSSLSGEKIENLFASRLTGAQVITAMPKFETEFSCNMADILSHMGMVNAFEPSAADFSRLGHGAGNIYIKDVIHKTRISVDERGTKAGAATLVDEEAGCAPTEFKYVTLDRPFVYMLIDCEKSLPLFIGTLVDI